MLFEFTIFILLQGGRGGGGGGDHGTNYDDVGMDISEVGTLASVDLNPVLP